MRWSTYFRQFAAAAVTLLLASNAWATNLLANGSFEQQIINNPATNNLWQLTNNLPGWHSVRLNTGLPPAQIPGYVVEQQREGLFRPQDNAPHGAQWVELDLDGLGIGQTVETVVGAIYQLVFAYSPRPDIEWQDALVATRGVDGAIHELAKVGGRGKNFINGIANSPDFSYYSATFIGTGLDTIFFGSLFTKTVLPNGTPVVTPGGGNLFDDFRLTFVSGPPVTPPPGGGEIPEPMTVVLLGSALVGGLRLRRRISVQEEVSAC